MKPPASRFFTSLSASARPGAGGLAVTVLLLGALALAGCNEEPEQLATLTDSFQKHLDEKEKELTSLRLSEKALQTQLAEMKGQLTAMQAELEASRARANIDAAALAKELAPLLTSRPSPAEPMAPPSRPSSKTGSGIKTTGGETRRQIPFEWEQKAPPAR